MPGKAGVPTHTAQRPLHPEADPWASQKSGKWQQTIGVFSGRRKAIPFGLEPWRASPLHFGTLAFHHCLLTSPASAEGQHYR